MQQPSRDLMSQAKVNLVLNQTHSAWFRYSSEEFADMIVDQFEEMLRLSQKQSLVFGVSMHTFCTGQPFRLMQVRQALEALAGVEVGSGSAG